MATVRKGTKSSAQDNFIGPNNVSGVSSTNVGSGRAYNDGRIDVSWTNPSTGNTPTGYKVYDGSTLKATIAHPTSTAEITGLASNTSYTFTVKAYDSYGEASGVSASAVTATTVPATPSAPSASAQGSAATDDVSWSAPADGGSAITNYHWESDDGKSGDTGTSTSVSVGQEAGSAQSYRVYATNANGNSSYSSYSSQVTSFSFTPFGFTPFGAFGFTPFGFTPFGFTPFGFTPFGFTPFGAFGFTPWGGACLEGDSFVRTATGWVQAKEIQVGDSFLTLDIPEFPLSGPTGEGDANWREIATETITPQGLVSATVTAAEPREVKEVVWFNGETETRFSVDHPMCLKGSPYYVFKEAGGVQIGEILIKVDENGNLIEVPVTQIDSDDTVHTVYKFSCEPQDWFVAGGYLTHNK